MFYQEPLQQSIYTNNQYSQYQQANNIQLNGNNYYNNQPSLDYDNDLYNQYQDNGYYNNNNNSHNNNINGQGYAPQPAQRQNKPPSQLGNKYTAQPLQPPVNDNYYNEAENSTLDLSLLKTTLEKQPNLIIQQLANNNNSTLNGGLSEEDLKRQQVWNKLQKANKDVKRRSDSRTKNGLPPVTNNLNASQISVKSNQPTTNKKVIVVKPAIKPNNNHIERNVEIIRNKENLVHRYPEKKYEAVYGKNIEARVKTIHGNEKKPPHHLQPIDNMDDVDDQNIQKQISITDEIYANLDTSRKITIPINSNMYKDKDHINVDINLKLSDFIPNNQNNNSYNNTSNNMQASSRSRYYDDFEINNDPLSKHIQRFEGISRSLPGSSGSLNKTKPLPPVNKRMQNYYNQDSNRLQHEHEILNEPKGEGKILKLIQDFVIKFFF